MKNSFRLTTVVTGLLVIAAGVLLTLFNMGVIDPWYRHIVFSWQALVIALGIVQLFSGRWHSTRWGILLILAGGYFMLPKLNIEGTFLELMTRNMWAPALFAAGVVIVMNGIAGGRRRNEYREPGHGAGGGQENGNRNWGRDGRTGSARRDGVGYIDRNYVFGGTKERPGIEEFKGGEINCVFGGMELDLGGSTLAEGVHTLELNSVFGGIVVSVPRDWKVEIRQTNVFGHFSDNRQTGGYQGDGMEQDNSRVLVIEAASVFGGGELKYSN